MASHVLTPEEAQLFAQLSGVQGQQELADNELAKAAALRRMPAVHAGGKWGGIAAGVANALNGINAAISDRMGTDQKKAAWAQNSTANQGLLEQLRRQQLLEQAQGEMAAPTAPSEQMMIAPTGTK